MSKIKLSIYKHSKENKDGKSQVYVLLRNRETKGRKLISLFQISKKDWVTKTRRPHHNCYMKIQFNKQIDELLDYLHSRIVSAESNAEYYDEKTLSLDYTNRNKSKSIEDAFDQKIAYLESQNKLGNKLVYQHTKTFFKKLLSDQIDLKNLGSVDMVRLIANKYYNSKNKSTKPCEGKNPISNATIRLRLRTLSALYDWMSRQNKSWKLPSVQFDDWKREFPDDSVKKIPLTHEEITNLIENATPINDEEKLLKNLFKLSYYLMGINFIDILFLQNKDLHKQNGNAILHYDRTKTSNTKRNSEFITIPIQDIVLQIIKAINQGNNHPTKLINIGNPERTDYKYFINLGKKMRKKTNQFIRREAKILGIDKKVNLHILRITSGTILFDSGVNQHTIAKLFNHSRFEITQSHYINSNRLDFNSDATSALY